MLALSAFMRRRQDHPRRARRARGPPGLPRRPALRRPAGQCAPARRARDRTRRLPARPGSSRRRDTRCAGRTLRPLPFDARQPSAAGPARQRARRRPGAAAAARHGPQRRHHHQPCADDGSPGCTPGGPGRDEPGGGPAAVHADRRAGAGGRGAPGRPRRGRCLRLPSARHPHRRLPARRPPHLDRLRPRRQTRRRAPPPRRAAGRRPRRQSRLRTRLRPAGTLAGPGVSPPRPRRRARHLAARCSRRTRPAGVRNRGPAGITGRHLPAGIRGTRALPVPRPRTPLRAGVRGTR